MISNDHAIIFIKMNSLIGKKVKAVREMTYEEMLSEHWDYQEGAMVIVFEDGTKVYASVDYEGNGAGALFGTYSNGKKFYV